MSDWILARLKPHNRIEWSQGCLTLALEFTYNKKKYFESKTKFRLYIFVPETEIIKENKKKDFFL